MSNVISMYKCPYCEIILHDGDIDRCPNCLNSFSCPECFMPETVEVKNKDKQELFLNHGDICNEIETRLGLYDHVTGNDLKSRNTHFRVQFDETDMRYLKVTIEKELLN